MFSADKAQEALIMLLYYMATILIGAAWCNKATALAQGQNEAESFSGKLLLEAFFVAFFFQRTIFAFTCPGFQDNCTLSLLEFVIKPQI